jgi:aryl-alcohol dehydrogenase-like predicted oxidoreductase
MEAQEMFYRTLGRTGEKVSVIGIGGGHIGSPAIDDKLSIRIIRSAIDRGITFMDNGWDYNGGASEIRMGKALRDGYRDRVFLMTKIDGRSKKEAMKQLDESLRRLQVDVIDLVQHHEVIRYEDPHRIFDEEGANAALVEAREAGKIRYIGFTGHKDPRIHAYMLEVAANIGFLFDAVQMPLSVVDAQYRSFEKGVLPELVQRGIGAIAMKTMAGGILLRSGAVTPVECLHYVLNLPISTIVTGIDSMETLDQACDAVRTFSPMNELQVRSLLSRTAQAAGLGEFELFKTTSIFDGTPRHPEWLGDEPERFRQFMPEK